MQHKLLDLEKCKCDNVAAYWYAPASDDKSCRYFCETCVPRGCSCNHEHLDNEHVVMPTKEDEPFIWIDDKTWTKVDEEGRQYPCVEFWYDENGYEKEGFFK